MVCYFGMTAKMQTFTNKLFFKQEFTIAKTAGKVLLTTSGHWGTVVLQTLSRRSTEVVATQKEQIPRNLSVEFLHLGGPLRGRPKFVLTYFPESAHFSTQTSAL